MDYNSFSEEITKMIRPQSYPLGMKLLKEENTLPEKAVSPAKEMEINKSSVFVTTNYIVPLTMKLFFFYV